MAAPPPSDVNQSATLDGCDKPPAPPPPFDDPKADVIIRSSDNMHFYVHKALLSIVSPVFEGMFALLDGTQELYDNRPCLSVTDDSYDLLRLLSWCDPRSSRGISPTLDDLTITLSIAKKYGVDSMFANARKLLLAHCSVGSLRVYAIAIRFRLDDVAQKAAQATLQLSLASHKCPDLKHISAFAIQNLHNYHFRCKKAVRDLLASESWVKDMKTVAHHLTSREGDRGKPHTHGVERFSLKRLAVVGGGALWLSTAKTTSWWSDYVEAMMYVLNDRPSILSLQIPSLVEALEETISLDECKQCSKYGYKRLDAVSRYLTSIIDETVSKVCKLCWWSFASGHDLGNIEYMVYRSLSKLSIRTLNEISIYQSLGLDIDIQVQIGSVTG